MTRFAVRALIASAVLASSLAGNLSAQLQVSGSIEGPDGKPLAAATVHLLPILPGFAVGQLRLEGREVQPAAASISDERGRFVLSAPQEGIYRVRVAAAGRVPMRSGPLALVEPTELPPVTLGEDARLSLQLVDSRGRGAAGVWVFAEPADAPSRSAVWQPDFRLGQTDADGRLALPRFLEERLTVTWLEGGIAAGTQVLEGPATLPLAIVSAARRQVRVVDPEGKPLAGLLLRAGPQAWPVGLTDAQGIVVLRGEPVARLDLRVTDPRGFSIPHVLDTQDAQKEQPVTVRFPEAGILAGQVRDADTGRPVTGALVWSPADPGSFTRGGPDGRFQQRAPEPGTFWLEAVAPGYLPKRIQATPAQMRTGRGLAFALTRAQSLLGQVVDPQGRAVEGAWIDAELEHPGERPPSFGLEILSDGGATGSGGSFELRCLYGGVSYTLLVQRAGFLPTRVTATVPDRGSSLPLKIVLQPSPRAFGQVRDLQGRAVSRAEVELAPSARRAGRAPLRTITDEKGRFSIAELPSLDVDLAVRKGGFAVATFRNLKLPSNRPAVDLGNIVLRPGATVRGRIVDRRGRPVAAARIHEVEDLSRLDQIAEKLAQKEPLGRSSSRGEFKLPDRPAGSAIHLLILAEGYRPEGLRGVRVPAAKPLAVTLTDAFTIRGRALDERGEPVADAVVELSVQEIIPDAPGHLPAGRESSKGGSTDREGRFTLAGFPAGDAEISLRAPGFLPTEQKLVLPLAEPAAELTFTLTRGTELAGRVTMTDGRPVAGARIVVGSSAARSDDDGFYQLAGLPLGDAEVELVHPHFPRQHRTETLVAGANRLDFRLPTGQDVRGEVRDEDGKPISGAWVRLHLATPTGRSEHSARSGQDGSFHLGPVADGRYLLRATAAGYAEGRLRRPILVKGEPVEGVEVILPRGADLVGRVAGLNREELWRLRVEAQGEDGRTYPAKLDTEGRYEIRALALGGWLVKATLGSGERQAQARAELRHGGEVVERDLEFEDRLRLTGRVLFLDEPLAGARVTLLSEHRTVERATLTDHQGGFELDDLEPDTYRIGVTHERRLVVHNGKLALTEDRDIVLDLQGVTVRGTLADAATGEPIRDAMVSLLHQPGPETTEFMVAGTTDDTGAFALPRVPPGRYRLRGQAEGYVAAEQPTEIPSQDEVTGLEIALTPTPGLEIVVRRTDGRIPPVVHFRAVSAGQPDIAGSRVPDAQGRLRLPTPSEGSWLLWLGAPGCGTTKITAQAPGPPATAELPPATRLAVQVPELITSDVRADIAVLGPDGSPLPVLGPGGILQQTWPTVGGKILIEDLPAGTLTIDARTGDGRRWSTTVVAAAASHVPVTLE